MFKFLEMVNELLEYLNIEGTPYGYSVLEVKRKENGSYEFKIKEGNFYPFKLTICENGIILNEYGHDCIDTCLDAYDYDEESIKLYSKFKAKWYK